MKPKPQPLDLYAYNAVNLAKVLSNDFISENEVLVNKFHHRFLIDYLGDETPDSLAAKTIVVENEYISRAYINDYSAYYSLCFSDNYTRKCKRVHFFKNEFNETEFVEDIVSNTGEIVNNDTYLGYIVVKNLPAVIIGATLLKTYSNNPARFYVTRDCQISLFGKRLTIKSLVFQEQDKVVSACATTALWVAFYKTSLIFQTPLPSPSEITSSAKNSFHFSGRVFPNKEGLDHFQIGNAIEKVGLVFELRNKEIVNNYAFVRSFIYAYCRLGLPVLLGIKINGKGRHLITISGFKNEQVEISRKSKSTKGVYLISQTIESFYAHDDRIGPYSRLQIMAEKSSNEIVETSWWIDNNGNDKYKASIASIIVPLYKKIRITFEDILNEVRKFNFIFQEKLGKQYKLVWDIYLQASSDYKEEVILNDDLSNGFTSDVVLMQLPKYVWISRLYVNDTIIFELVFDSTDVAQGQFCLLINCYDNGFLEVIKDELKVEDFREYIKTKLYPKYLDILESLDNEAPSCGNLPKREKQKEFQRAMSNSIQ